LPGWPRQTKVRRTALNLILSSSESGEQQYLVVSTSPFLVGRADGNDLRIPHPEVSGQHAELALQNGTWRLKDLGSTNGTFVNGVRILSAVPLCGGEILHFGPVSYRVVNEVQSCSTPSTTVNAPETLAKIKGVVEVYRILEQGRGRVHFQPIVSLPDAEPMGWEALGRAFPLPGVDTETLFELAALDQIAAKLSRVFSHRARQCVECGRCWPNMEPACVFLNLHPEEILTPNFAEFLEDIGSSPMSRDHRVVLEFPEALADKNREMEVWMAMVRENGMQVAFDDFAKGQSRIADLVTTPPDFLKIDRELIVGLGCGGPQETFLRGVVDTCLELNVQIIAEGIETEEQSRVCVDLGIPYAQGFLYGKPAPAYEMFSAEKCDLPLTCPFRTLSEAPVGV
jgi:EAL domain-containing protein (putative c-di-GMP-specific phosphodiesterase class I)